MLPPGASADLVGPAEQHALKAIHPDAQTIARLLVGRCSCDFVRSRHREAREDERHLRDRYRRLEAPRTVVIPSLDRHRRGAGVRSPGEGWPRALARLVAEHARNAGPTLYHLHFSPGQPGLGSIGTIRQLSVAQVTGQPEQWLLEGSPALVSR